MYILLLLVRAFCLLPFALLFQYDFNVEFVDANVIFDANVLMDLDSADSKVMSAFAGLKWCGAVKCLQI